MFWNLDIQINFLSNFSHVCHLRFHDLWQFVQRAETSFRQSSLYLGKAFSSKEEADAAIATALEVLASANASAAQTEEEVAAIVEAAKKAANPLLRTRKKKRNVATATTSSANTSASKKSKSTTSKKTAKVDHPPIVLTTTDDNKARLMLRIKQLEDQIAEERRKNLPR